MPKEDLSFTSGQRRVADELRHWIYERKLSQLAIVTGMAGIGKTSVVRAALGNEDRYPRVVYVPTGGRDATELLNAIERELSHERTRPAVVIVDDVEMLTGSERQFEELAAAIFELPWDRYQKTRPRHFPGIVNWVLVGRNLPRELERKIAQQKPIEPPLMLHLSGMSREELTELLRQRIERGLPQLSSRDLAVWAAVAQTQLGGNPAAALQLAEAIASGMNPYAVLDALLPKAALTLTMEAVGLQVIPTVQLPTVGVDSAKGLVTFAPQIYLPKVAVQYRAQVTAFEALIRKPKVKEAEIQQFLEGHPHFLMGLDYRKLVPHPVLERTEKSKLIPDFFLQPCDGDLVDILDLKLPNKTLFTGTADRLKLSEAVSSALAQVREYKDYFENEENKRRILRRYGVTAYRPKVSVVIGLDERVLPEEKRKQIMDATLPAGASVITYRQLAEKMRRHADLLAG